MREPAPMITAATRAAAAEESPIVYGGNPTMSLSSTTERVRKLTGGGEMGFSFDEDTMRGLVREWHALADSYESSRRTARDMVTVEGPGTDFASQGYAEAAARSGCAYLDYLAHHRDYCAHQAQLFQQALDDYLGAEDTTVADMKGQA